jgi:ERCC4-type nuclease
VDLSIPYDAASLIAYKEWKHPFFLSQEGEETIFDEALYQKFKVIYKTKTVAAMKLKKVERDTAEILSKGEKDLAALME